MFRGILIVSFALILCSIDPVHSIRCYVCQGQLSGDCATHPTKYQDCDHEDRYCGKAVTTYGNERFIYRTCNAGNDMSRCDVLPNNMKQHLGTTSLRVDSCDFCESNYCNSSNKYTFSLLTMIISFIIINRI